MKSAALDTRPLFWEHQGNRAVSRPDGEGDWKLVAEAGGPWELYDLSRDRIESNDLSDEMPERVAELSALWDDWAAENEVLPLGGWRGAAAPVKQTNR
jgi:arylsulfatase